MSEQLWRGPLREGETAEGTIFWERGDDWAESFGAVRLSFDEMVERMLDDEWEATGVVGWDESAEVPWRVDQRPHMERRLRAAVGEGEG